MRIKKNLPKYISCGLLLLGGAAHTQVARIQAVFNPQPNDPATSNFSNYGMRLSSNGKFVVIQSDATNLVQGDTNGQRDIFLRDLVTQTTARLNVSPQNVQTPFGESGAPTISADGGYVVFHSYSDTLVTPAPNANNGDGFPQIYLRNRNTNQTIVISRDTQNQFANQSSYNPIISADGNYVAFESVATDLIVGDTNNFQDVFLRDLTNSTTTRVSLHNNGNQVVANSYLLAISADGHSVLFTSNAPFVSGDNNNKSDIFLRDTVANTTTRVSVGDQGQEGNQDSGTDLAAVMSADGNYIVFRSESNLVTGKGAGLFVRDRAANKTSWIADGKYPSISEDGRFITFQSLVNNIVPGDVDGDADVFFYDRQTGAFSLLSMDKQKNPGRGYQPWIAGNGQSVVFHGNGTGGSWVLDYGTDTADGLVVAQPDYIFRYGFEVVP